MTLFHAATHQPLCKYIYYIIHKYTDIHTHVSTNSSSTMLHLMIVHRCFGGWEWNIVSCAEWRMNRRKQVQTFFFSQSLISCIIFFLLFLPTSISYLNFLPLSSFFPALYLFFIHFFSRVSPIFLPDSILLIFCPPYLPSFLSSGPWRGTKSYWISGESVYTYIFTYVQGPSVTTLSSISLFCKKC